MSTQKFLRIFLGLLFLQTVISSTLNIEILDSCYNNPAQFSNENFGSELIEKIKTQIIPTSQAKQAILDNSVEFEKVRRGLLKCTEELMKKNQFKTLEKFIDEVLDPFDLDFSNEMKLIGTLIKKEIDNIITVAHAKRHTQTVSPAFQWIQNKTHVFLQIKFAHRHDAPGCLEVKNEKIEFTESGMTFSAFGVQAQQPIQFNLNLAFYKEILPEQSTWNLESVVNLNTGRLFVSITKANSEIWVSLLKNNEKLPQMRLWWEMKDNYKDDMKEYEKLLEQQEEMESNRKSSKGRRAKKAEEAAPESGEKQVINEEL